MREELHQIERVERYVNGELSTSEQAEFEAELNQSVQLQELVEFQKLTAVAASRSALRAEIAAFAPKKPPFWQSGLGMLTGAIIVVGALSAAYFLKGTSEDDANHQDKDITTVSHVNEVSTNNESSETMVLKEEAIESNVAPTPSSAYQSSEKIVKHKDGASAPFLPYQEQVFQFDAKDGGVFEGNSGTLVIVPPNALRMADGSIVNGAVEFRLIEALELADMLAYNLTTMNGDLPLSSGGMIRTAFLKRR